MPRSRRFEHGAEFLSGREAIERHREPLLVIDALPLTQLGRGSLEVLEGLAAPELLLVDPVAAFHLAVLFRTPRADVAMLDPAALYREDEGERELRAVIGLDLANGEWKGADDFGDEVQTGTHMEPAVEPQDPEAGAVVQGGVLVRLGPAHLDELHVNLDRLAGRGLLEQLELPRRAPALGA